jgi:hypothetical protein
LNGDFVVSKINIKEVVVDKGLQDDDEDEDSEEEEEEEP